MSLVQHLSAIDGVDREPEADEGDDYISIRRKISYDVLQPPNEGIPVAELRPGSLAFDHSPSKRISTNYPPRGKSHRLTPSSSGHRHRARVLERVGDRLWLRGVEAGSRRRRRLPRAMYPR